MKRLAWIFLHAFWVVVVVALPVVGAWIASSLAAYHGHSPWLAALVALLLFPIAPLAWEAWAGARRASGARQFLTVWDRLSLRTLAISVAFLTVMLATNASTAFAALATRGDWMLGGAQGPEADTARRELLAAAQALEWLYVATHPNPYDDGHEARAENAAVPDPNPARAPNPSPDPTLAPTPTPNLDSAPTPDPEPIRTPALAEEDAHPQLHPLVASMPPEAEASIATVGAYLAAHEPDPFQRAKAVHDWVADRIAYDGLARRTGKIPAQDAASVFHARKAVCAGYSHLFAAIARHAALEAVYVVGDARDAGLRAEGESHAWNAVKIAGAWHLVDATWDSGYLEGDRFVKAYRTSYFVTPPEIFGVDHHPNDRRWQLRDAPISRAAFLRLPLDRAASRLLAVYVPSLPIAAA
jgi:hypothetical protein